MNITIDNDDTRHVGDAKLTPFAKQLFEQMAASRILYVLAPQFVIKKQDEDGTIHEAELVGLTAIPAERMADIQMKGDNGKYPHPHQH